jgi:hypothetical protein
MNTDSNYKDWLISYHEGYRHAKQLRRNNNRNKCILSAQIILIVLMVLCTIVLNVIDFKEGVLPIVGLSIYLIYKLKTCKRNIK